MLISMGFFILIERKLIGLVHYRFGPNKILLNGLLQFLIDLVKLFIKENVFIYLFKLNYLVNLFLILIFSLIF